MAKIQELYEAILNGDNTGSKSLTEKALADGANPKELLDESMIPAMDEVGRLFESEEYFIPELLIAARAMKSSLDLVRPLLAESGVEPVGKVLVGTVLGDLHDIGKNLVGSMLEGGGFEVIDLGVDVSPEAFIQAIEEQGAELIAISALLTTTMPTMKTTIDKLVEAGVRDRVRVIVGGAPVTQEFADKIGADGYCETANGAVTLARNLIAA